MTLGFPSRLPLCAVGDPRFVDPGRGLEFICFGSTARGRGLVSLELRLNRPPSPSLLDVESSTTLFLLNFFLSLHFPYTPFSTFNTIFAQWLTSDTHLLAGWETCPRNRKRSSSRCGMSFSSCWMLLHWAPPTSPLKSRAATPESRLRLWPEPTPWSQRMGRVPSPRTYPRSSKKLA